MRARTRRRALAAGKLALLLTLGLVALRLTTPASLLGLLALVAAAAALARVRARALLRPALGVLPFVLALFAAHAFLHGWEQGVVVALRLLALVLAAATVTASTPVGDLLDVLETACRPLRLVGVDPARVGLVLAMAMRFVPLLGHRVAALREAQRARGVERPGASVVAPLVVGTLRMADDLAAALDARGLADPPQRSPLATASPRPPAAPPARRAGPPAEARRRRSRRP